LLGGGIAKGASLWGGGVEFLADLVGGSDLTGGTGADSGAPSGDTSSDSPSGASPPGDVANPEAFCPEDSSEVKRFNEGELSDNLEKGEDMDEEELKKQWCAFQNSDDKQTEWDKLSPDQRNSFMEAVGEQYGMKISGVGGEGSSWEGENLVVGGKKINMDFEKFYGEDNKKTEFGFKGDKHTYDRKAIRGIDVDAEGNVKVSFGGYGGSDEKYTDASSLTLSGDGAEFNPETMEITSGGKKYEWNGQGEVDFGGEKLSMKFAPGKSSGDVTNFPIMKLDEKTEVSPFQEVSGKKAKDIKGLDKVPSKGYIVSENGEYTIDQYGTVRQIMEAEVTIADGKVEAIKDSYLGMDSLKGDLFANGEYGIGKGGDYSSFINLEGDTLVIVSDGSNKLYYHQGSNLKKIHATGKGTTYIRNGDYVLKFEKGKLKTRLLPKVFHRADGKYGFTADEIVNVDDAKDPYKIGKGKDGKKILTNSKGDPVDLSTGKVKTPASTTSTPTGTGTPTTTTTEDAKGAAEKHVKESGGGYSVSAEVYSPKAGNSLVTSDTISINGINNLDKDLTYDQFKEKIGNELSVTFKLNVLHGGVLPTDVDVELTKMGMEQGMKTMIIEEFKLTHKGGIFGGAISSTLAGGNKGNSLSITLSGGQITDASWAGEPLTSKAKQFGPAGVTFMQGVLSQAPTGADVKYGGTSDKVEHATGHLFYEKYKKLHP